MLIAALCAMMIAYINSSNRTGLPTYTIKLLKDELYEIEYSKFSSKIKQLEVVHTAPPNSTADTNAQLKKNYYFQGYIVYPDLERDCIAMYMLDGGLSTFDGDNNLKPLPQINVTGIKQVLSRTMKVTREAVYIMSSYAMTRLTETDPFVNRLETVKVNYKDGKMTAEYLPSHDNKWREELSNQIDFPSLDPNQPPIRNRTWTLETVCISQQYLAIFKENVALCANISYTDEENNKVYEYEVYFQRFGTGQVRFLKKYHNSELYAVNIDKIMMVIEPTLDRSFEVFIYIKNTRDMFNFQVNANEITNFHFYKFQWSITLIHYVASSLMIISSDEDIVHINNNSTSKTTAQKLYYLERYPGTKLKLSQLEMFAESKFLRGHFSSENIEIIIETYKHSTEALYGAGFYPPVTHLMYSYSLVTKTMKQISTQIFVMPLIPPWCAIHFRVESFSFLDNLIVNTNTLLFTGFTEGLTNRIRTSIITYLDVYSGFGSVALYNSTFNIYSTHSVYDVLTNTYTLLPFKTPQVVGNKMRFCSILKLRIARPRLVIQNQLNSDTLQPLNGSMTLLIRDSFYNRNTYYMKLEFLDPKVYKETQTSIWVGSDQLVFEINANQERRAIELDALVGGSYVIKKFTVENNRLPFSYSTEEVNRAEEITKHSFFEVRNTRVRDQNDILIKDLDFIYAMERVQDEKPVETIVFLKKTKYPLIFRYSFKNGEQMRELGTINMNEQILKVFPLEQNLFILFLSDGSLKHYNAKTESLDNMPFPGVNCYDMEQIYHPNLKPSLLCLNFNLELTVYYLDELIAKSLSYSLYRAEFDLNSSKLTSESKIYSTEFYAGKIFLYTPSKTQSKSPLLSVYFLEIEEFPVFILLKHQELSSSQLEAIGEVSVLTSLAFSDQRLVVLFRGIIMNENYIVCYEFNEENNMDMKMVKKYLLPTTLQLTDKSRYFRLYKHFQSNSHANEYKPLLALPILRQNGGKKGFNVLVVDPFAPLIETVPTVLFPRDSLVTPNEEMFVFPYYLPTADRFRFWSVGVLHHQKLVDEYIRHPTNFYYLFQFVVPSELKVYLTINRTKLVSHESVFKVFQPEEKISDVLHFESYLHIDDPDFQISRNVEMQQRRTSPLELSSSNSTVSMSIAIQTNYSQQNGNIDFREPQLLLYEENFTALLDAPVLSWELETESHYDTLLHQIVIDRPAHVAFVKQIQGLRDMVKLARFCRCFKQTSTVLDTPECIKFGWVFFYDTELEIYYEDNLEQFEIDKSIKFPFNAEHCTEMEVIKQMLITVCLVNYARSKVITNLIDLSQTYIPLHWVAIYPQVTFPKVTKYLNDSIVQYSKVITDEKNVQGVANTYYYLYRSTIDIKSSEADCVSPFYVKSDQFYGFDSKLTDTAVGATYITSNRTYRVSGINVNIGNLVHFQLVQESYIDITMPNNTQKRVSLDLHRYVFSVNSSVEIKKLVLNRATIYDVVFENPADYISENMTNYWKYALLNFPNYHSYLIRYKTFIRNSISFYKLYNSFAELENEYRHRKPCSCFKWACAIVSKFGDLHFIRIYDMMPEKRREDGSANFNEVFGEDDHASGNFTYSEEKQPFFMLDLIPENYTVFPIEVYNVTNLHIIEFDDRYFNPKHPEQLRLIVVSNPNQVTALNLNRKFRLYSNNIYFASKWAIVSLKKAYSITKKYRFDFLGFEEHDYYKYFIHVGSVLVISSIILVMLWRKLNKIKTDSEDELELELRQKIELSYIHEEEQRGLTAVEFAPNETSFDDSRVNLV